MLSPPQDDLKEHEKHKRVYTIILYNKNTEEIYEFHIIHIFRSRLQRNVFFFVRSSSESLTRRARTSRAQLKY